MELTVKKFRINTADESTQQINDERKNACIDVVVYIYGLWWQFYEIYLWQLRVCTSFALGQFSNKYCISAMLGMLRNYDNVRVHKQISIVW